MSALFSLYVLFFMTLGPFEHSSPDVKRAVFVPPVPSLVNRPVTLKNSSSSLVNRV